MCHCLQNKKRIPRLAADLLLDLLDEMSFPCCALCSCETFSWGLREKSETPMVLPSTPRVAGFSSQ